MQPEHLMKMDISDLTFDKSGGILLQTLKSGTSDDGPRMGDRVFVHYTGRLDSEDGTVFDSSIERGEPFQFTLGRSKAGLLTLFHCYLE